MARGCDADLRFSPEPIGTLPPVTEIRCERCGRPGERGDLEWSSAVRDGAMVPLCGQCTRDHVRDIESKLDEAWWAPPPSG
jgi:hypothetical protein